MCKGFFSVRTYMHTFLRIDTVILILYLTDGYYLKADAINFNMQGLFEEIQYLAQQGQLEISQQ